MSDITGANLAAACFVLLVAGAGAVYAYFLSSSQPSAGGRRNRSAQPSNGTRASQTPTAQHVHAQARPPAYYVTVNSPDHHITSNAVVLKQNFAAGLAQELMDWETFFEDTLQCAPSPLTSSTYGHLGGPGTRQPVGTMRRKSDILHQLTPTANIIDGQSAEVICYYTGHGFAGSGNWVVYPANSTTAYDQVTLSDLLDQWTNEPRNRNHDLTIISDCCQSGHWLTALQNHVAARTFRIAVVAACGPQQSTRIGALYDDLVRNGARRRAQIAWTERYQGVARNW